MEVAEGSFFDLALLPDLATFLDHFFCKDVLHLVFYQEPKGNYFLMASF